MMSNRSEIKRDENYHIGILLLRIFVGGRLIYGVLDNVLSWAHMQEFANFLSTHHFPIPLASAIISVYAQFIAGIAILFGLKTKFFALVMVFNFLIAIVFVHLSTGDSVQGMTPALAIFIICCSLVLTGPGRISVDHGSSARKQSGPN